MDKLEELKKLKGLLDNGFITQEEFNSLKNEILGKKTPVKQETKEKDVVVAAPSSIPKKEPALEPEMPSPEKVNKETNVSQEPDASTALDNEKKHSKEEEKKEDNLHESKRKCKKCDKEISKYLEDSNKGLCIECKNKNIKIPKWAYLFLLLLIPLLWLIFKESSKTSDNNNSDSPIVIKKFEIIGNDSEFNVANLDYSGEIVNKKTWIDSNGNNIVLFTKNPEELFVFHFVFDGSKPRLLREIKDFEYDCEYDLYIDFIANSIVVSDLDNDDLGEISFAYKKACISDLSPKALKFIMLENGEKYIIRGATILNINGERSGGEKNIDNSFSNAPAIFLTNSNKIWDNIVEENIGQDRSDKNESNEVSIENSKSSEIGFIKGTDVIIRQAPNTSSKIIGSFKNSGEKVAIIDELEASNNSEAILNKNVDIYDSERETIHVLRKGKALYIISKNDESYIVSIQDKELKGHKLKLSFKDVDVIAGNWYKVKRNNGQIGWVFGKFISFD